MVLARPNHSNNSDHLFDSVSSESAAVVYPTNEEMKNFAQVKAQSYSGDSASMLPTATTTAAGITFESVTSATSGAATSSAINADRLVSNSAQNDSTGQGEKPAPPSPGEAGSGRGAVDGAGSLGQLLREASSASDGSTVSTDSAGQVSQVKYADGTTRQFAYGPDHQVNKVTETDGSVWTKDDNGSWHDDRGHNSSVSQVSVFSDGTYTLDFPDKTSQTRNTDGSNVMRDSNNRVTSIQYKNGEARSFEYSPGSFDVSKVVEADGSVWIKGVNGSFGNDGAFHQTYSGQETGFVLDASSFVRWDGTYVVNLNQGKNYIVTGTDGKIYQ